jgi:hypothetical protein
MSDIETRTRDIALPLIQGRTGLALSRKDQEQLAAWCFLKAITLELGRPDAHTPTYPSFVYTGFRQHRQPPRACLITVGHREMPEDPPLFVWFKSQGEKHALPDGRDLAGYRMALSIGHFVVEVFGVLGRAVVAAEDDPRFVQVWPVGIADSLDWPPPAAFKGIVGNNLV